MEKKTEIKLNSILGLTEEEIANSKIELNMNAGSGGESFLERWLTYSDENKATGTCSSCSYWGWYGSKQRNFYPNQWVFSFARMTGDEWLLISAAKIIDVPKDDWAMVEVLERFKPLFGRLIVNCKKGNTFHRYVFNLDKYLEQVTVKEILPGIYSGEKFEGYDRVHLSFRKLQNILHGKMMPTYLEALTKITGVYCLTDTHTGKLYIGSAYSEGGVAQRWGNYLDSRHGDNVKLIALYQEKGPAYFEEYFTFTLLEYFGLSYDVGKILERENYWKDCLNTRIHGYNGN